jgi:hypothetical protein
MLDQANAVKLEKKLLSIPKRTIKDAYERIIGDGSKLAGVMRRLTIEAQRRPKDAFQKWK